MSGGFSLSPLVKSSSQYGLSHDQNWNSSNLVIHDEAAFNFTGLHSPPLVSEMIFEKTEDFICQYDEIMPYKEEPHFQNFSEEFGFSGDAQLIKSRAFEAPRERGAAMNEEEEEGEFSQNENEEEVGSISTTDSNIAGFLNMDGDSLSFNQDSQRFALKNSKIDARVRAKVSDYLWDKNEEEKAYINGALPMLIRSFQELCSNCSFMFSDSMIESALLQLLEEKRTMFDTETQFIHGLVEDEIKATQGEMPEKIIGENDLNLNKRKTKKIFKGNKNNSSLNHINENYISNIFQFAKKNFPDDRELQRLANERNVSAVNFRRLMSFKLTDSSLTRRAKIRVMMSGQELVSNIEYWMNEGYFDQCNDREKYIAHKHKALIDLGLSENC